MLRRQEFGRKVGLFSQQVCAWGGPTLVMGIICQSSTQKIQILSELCNKFALGNFGQVTLVAVSRHSSHNGCNHSFFVS